MDRIGPSFFQQNTLDIAQKLLGCQIHLSTDKGILSGIIVETEAYRHLDDPACHAARGKTNRNRVMFGPPGKLYVYAIHNRYCMNIVTENQDLGAAVLIRALEPVLGVDAMLQNRPVACLQELTNGPGKLCQALGITTANNGICLVSGMEMWIEPNKFRNFAIRTTPRIGISQAQELPYRFLIDGNRFVSGLARDHSIPKLQSLQASLPSMSKQRDLP